MNLEAIKAKLAALSSGGQDREKVDYEKIFWRPVTGKHIVRLVPSMYDPTYPFKEMKFHYNIGKFPMIALSNFGKQDPIEEFVKELRKTSDKDNWSLSGKISPKSRILAPVIIRGEEEKGVRLWSFGLNIYKALLALAEDEDIGDYTDVINGYDMVVEQTPGTPYPTTSVRIKPKTSPLSTNNDNVDLWLKTQPNPMECFTQYDYDYIKKQLQEYLTPGEESATTVVDTEPDQAPSVVPGTGIMEEKAFTLEAATKGNKSTVSKFDDLFN